MSDSNERNGRGNNKNRNKNVRSYNKANNNNNEGGGGNQNKGYNAEKEMEKDAEYRRLNAKIKEQEYRMKQMALSVQTNQDLTDRIVKKVEEEIYQKISKGAILSVMHKSSNNNNNNNIDNSSTLNSNSQSLNEENTSTTREFHQKSNKNNKSNTNKMNSQSSIESQKQHQGKIYQVKHINTNSNKIFKEEFKQQQLHNSNNLEELNNNNNNHNDNDNNNNNNNNNKLDSKIEERENYMRRIIGLESDIKRKIDEIRKNKTMLQDLCLLGPSNGAPEYALKCTEFESLILNELNETNIIFTCQQKNCQKLTDLKLKQLGIFYAVLSNAINSEARLTKEGMITQISNIFQNEITKAEMLFTTILQPLELLFHCVIISKTLSSLPLLSIKNDHNKNNNDNNNQLLIDKIKIVLTENEEYALRSCIHNIFMSLGELQRYIIFIHESFHTPYNSTHNTIYYHQALKIAPFNGSSYLPLALKVRSERNLFQTAYYLSLSLMTQEPLTTARDLLVEIFELSRQETEHFPVVTALSRMNPQEHLTHFKAHLLAAVGIGYSRTNADLFSFHSERCRRHLSTILQLLVIDILHNFESGKGSKGDYKHYDELAFLQSNNNNNSNNELFDNQILDDICPISYEISSIINESFIIILSLLTIVAEKHQLKEMYNSMNWKQCYINPQLTKKSGNNYHHNNQQQKINENNEIEINNSNLSIEEKLVYEKRYITQYLHKIQIIPGLLDLSRLLLGLVASLLSSEGVGMGIGTSTTTGLKSSHYNLITMSRMITTCPAVNLFFDWLTEHPEFHILSILDKVTWEQMESDLPAYVSSLSRFTTFETISLKLKKQWNSNDNQLQSFNINPRDCLVVLDYNLKEFLPLQSLFQQRFKKYTELYISSQSVLERIQEITTKNESNINKELENLYIICDSSSILPSEKDYSWFIIQAHRCVFNVRNLCNKVLTIGLNMIGIYDKNRQIIYPSSDRWDTFINQETKLPNSKQCLCVITYKTPLTMRQAGFGTSGYSNKSTIILTEKEFLQGSIPKELILSSSLPSSSSSSLEVTTTSSITNNNTNDNNNLQDLKGLEIETLPPPPLPLPSLPHQLFNQNDKQEELDEIIVYQPHQTENKIFTNNNNNNNINNVNNNNNNNNQEMQLSNSKGMLRVPSNTTFKKVENQYQNDLSNRTNNESVTFKRPKEVELPLIVVDTPNVAMRHGLNSKFSCRGIKLAIDFFHRAGHRVVAFLPDYYFNFERVGELRRSASLGVGSVRASQIPDDVHLLQQLVGQGFLIGTPAQDYDDSYCITYAKQRNGYIISNDLYRDHLKRYEIPSEREEMKKWLKSHVVSYTFVGDEFVPNPDASIN